TVTAEADRGYSVDTSAAASISLDAIAGDDILNAAEAAADVAVSGSVGGDAQEGDTVTLTIGSETYSGAVLAGNTFSINVPGSVLAANSSVNASVTATDSNGNTVTAEADRGYSVDLNIAPTGTDGVIALDEDSVHHFSADDFGFTDVNLGDTLQAVRIDSLPTAGSLQFNGTAVSAGQVIALTDLNNLTFTPAHDASGDSYTALTFSVSDQAGQFALAPSTLTFDVTPVADAPIVTIELGAANISTTTINTANVTASGQGFTVSAFMLDGTPGVISINGSPVGFGVVGDASGANNELGQSDGQSERIVVDFDAPVASATVSFAWLHTGERATYDLFDSAGNPIGSGTIAGLTDAVDPAITLTSSTGAAISRIEFSAPGGGDNDYLINSIEFVSSIDYPLTITATPTDIDYSESIASITVAVPAGASLSAGTANGDGTWTLPLTSAGGYSVVVDPSTKAVTITGLSMTIQGNPVGDLSVTVTATAQDGADSASTATTITLGDTGAPEAGDVSVVANEDSGPVAIILNATDTASSIANFTITSLPANGTLSYNGQEVLIGQAIPAIGNQASLSFTPNANWNGSTDFQYLTSDVAGNVDLTPATVSILINAVNDAPVNQLPASYTTDEDTTLKLSGLSVSDVDATTGLISVTLAVASGTLSAASANGVDVAGSGTGSIVLSGTLDDINAYLAAPASQPSYLPVADASGSVTLTMTSSDGGNTGAGGVLTDSDSINITINPVADAVPGSDVSVVIGAPMTNTINFGSNISGLDGQSSYTFPSGITLSTGDSGKVFDWSTGSLLSVQTSGVNGDNRIEGSDTIELTFPSGMQYLALKLKNAGDDTVLIRSDLEVGDLTSGTLSGTITSSSGLTVSSSNLKVDLVLEVLNGGTTSIVTQAATVNPGGIWSVSYSGVIGTITQATVVSTIDGDLFNQGGNTSANVSYSISSDMQSLSIAQDTANTFSASQTNNGFQIEYIAVDASPTGLTSYSYPVDIYAAIQDTVGTPESFTSLALSDLPAGSTISVVHADGSYEEIAPNTQGEYDLSAYTSLLSTETTLSGTDKLYLVTVSELPSGFAPTLTLEVSDGASVAKTIIGGSGNSTFTGGAGNDYIGGGAGNDSLDGGAGNDTLDGGTGNDILIGGAGDDILLGGTGADTFTWNAGDTGHDKIADFNIDEGDRIDLSDLLQGETDGTIDNFLQLVTSAGGTSSLLISTEGHLNDVGGTPAANADTSIELTGVNLSSSSINSLIAGADPVIKIDHA
uniref:beta strand repeat-containing protein n=1 Tax=Pseudomonas tumuqii TaxID=2715755 RepID=UPI001557FEE0